MKSRKKTSRRKRHRPSRAEVPASIHEGLDSSLLDIVDHVLTKGIVLTGDLVLGVADVDLVYLRLSAVLCAADRVLGKPPEGGGPMSRLFAPPRPASTPALISGKLGSALGTKR